VWTAILISHVIRFGLTYYVFVRGKWRDLKLELGEQQPVEDLEPLIHPEGEKSGDAISEA